MIKNLLNLNQIEPCYDNKTIAIYQLKEGSQYLNQYLVYEYADDSYWISDKIPY